MSFDNYFPFDTGSGSGATQDRWRKMGRLWYPSGVVPGYLSQMTPSIAGSIVTIQPGGVWIDGFYGEIQTAKTVSIPGGQTGQVVARMDTGGKTIGFLFVQNQTTPSQSVSATIYEIPIFQVTGSGAGKDARQWSANVITKPASGAIVKETQLHAVITASYSATAWSASWWSPTFTKVRPDTLLDFWYYGSAWGAVAGGAINYGLQITSSNPASSLGLMAHFFFNSAGEHHTIVGGLAGWGQELVNAAVTGTVTVHIPVQCTSATVPSWRIDGNDYHWLRVVERMP